MIHNMRKMKFLLCMRSGHYERKLVTQSLVLGRWSRAREFCAEVLSVPLLQPLSRLTHTSISDFERCSLHHSCVSMNCIQIGVKYTERFKQELFPTARLVTCYRH